MGLGTGCGRRRKDQDQVLGRGGYGTNRYSVVFGNLFYERKLYWLMIP